MMHPAPVLAGAALAQARRVALLVHGRNQDETVMLDVAQRLALTDVAYVLPVAAGGTWYPGRYYDPLEENQPDVNVALDSLQSALELAAGAGVADARVVVGGFSQGACLIAELAARRPRRWAGAAVLTGSLLGADGELVTPARQAGMPMFFGSSRHDEWITLERAQVTANAFAQAGAAVTFEVYDDREHLINDRAVNGLRRLLGSG
jgi:phospholipase/carboxylesterase